MCLTSTDFPEQFQSGSVSGFGFGLLGHKIKQLVMNKVEQPTLPLFGEARYLTSLYVSGQEGPHEEVKDKIRATLKESTFLEQNVLVQFWSLCDAGELQILTTIDQPFGLGVASEELCFYRRSSEHNAFTVDKDHQDKDLAIRCNLHGCMALPVFDIARKSCLGVLEILVSSKHMDYVHVVTQVHSALKVSNNLKGRIPSSFKAFPSSSFIGIR